MNDHHRVSLNALTRPPEEHFENTVLESQSSKPLSVPVATLMSSPPLISDSPQVLPQGPTTVLPLGSTQVALKPADPDDALPPRPRTSSQDKNTTTNLKIYYDKMLGKGSFSKVFPGRYKDNIVAVKIITMKHLEKTIAIQLKRELQVIRILQEHPHKNVATYYKIFQTVDKMIIVMELCSGGELTKYIKHGLDLESVRNYFSQILDGYKHLLELNIVHRDIKSANILLSQDKKTIKFIDFGLSKVFSVDLNQTICGSPLYMAPEVLDHQDYDSKSDIWSLGVLLYEMVYGFTPFHQCTVIKTLKQTVQRNAIVYPPMSTQNLYVVPPDLISYMKRLLEPDPRQRLDWDELHDARWLSDVSIGTLDVIHHPGDLYDNESNDEVSPAAPRTGKPVFETDRRRSRSDETKMAQRADVRQKDLHQKDLLRYQQTDQRPKSESLDDDLSVSQVEERIQLEKAATAATVVATETKTDSKTVSSKTVGPKTLSSSPDKPKQEISFEEDFIDLGAFADGTEHTVTKQPEVSMLTRELSRDTSTKAIRNLRHIPKISNIPAVRNTMFSPDVRTTSLADPDGLADSMDGQLNPFENDLELSDSNIEVEDVKATHVRPAPKRDPCVPASIYEKRSDPIPIRTDKRSGSRNGYDREDRRGDTGGRDGRYGMSFPASHGAEYIPRLTPVGSGPKGIRGESFGDVVCTELKMGDLSFIENSFSEEYAPLLEQQQKMASDSGLIDIDDVNDILITNVPGKTTTYEYISRGSTVVGSYLYSRSAPIATTVIQGLGKVARTTVGAVGNITTIISPK